MCKSGTPGAFHEPPATCIALPIFAAPQVDRAKIVLATYCSPPTEAMRRKRASRPSHRFDRAGQSGSLTIYRRMGTRKNPPAAALNAGWGMEKWPLAAQSFGAIFRFAGEKTNRF
jgi:hypothetical protein